MLCLGIESTAHSFGIGIIDEKGKIYTNQKITFQGEGMDLRMLSDFLTNNFDTVIKKALKELKTNKKTLKDIELISFSQGPGIGNSLKIGALIAKTISKRLKIPIIGVNHITAHLEIGKLLTKFKDPLFLYVSGVNTQIIAKDENGNYKIYSETEDLGLGNLLDSSGRILGLEFPAGPKIEEIAKKATKTTSKTFIELPTKIKGMNIALGGLVTKIEQLKNKGEKTEDICFSLQENIFPLVIEISERALAYTKKTEFTVVGGVAANQRLRDMIKEMGKQRKIKTEFFPIQYCMDNGLMIAWQGILDYKEKKTQNPQKDFQNITNLQPKPYITIESKL